MSEEKAPSLDAPVILIGESRLSTVVRLLYGVASCGRLSVCERGLEGKSVFAAGGSRKVVR